VERSTNQTPSSVFSRNLSGLHLPHVFLSLHESHKQFEHTSVSFALWALTQNLSLVTAETKAIFAEALSGMQHRPYFSGGMTS